MIFDAFKYKKAKTLVEDISEILSLLDVFLPLLMKYKKYTPVKHIINSTLDAKSLLTNHLRKQREIVRLKGQVDEKEISRQEFPKT